MTAELLVAVCIFTLSLFVGTEQGGLGLESGFPCKGFLQRIHGYGDLLLSWWGGYAILALGKYLLDIISR